MDRVRAFCGCKDYKVPESTVAVWDEVGVWTIRLVGHGVSRLSGTEVLSSIPCEFDPLTTKAAFGLTFPVVLFYLLRTEYTYSGQEVSLPGV